MKKTRKNYEKILRDLMKRATIRELAGLCEFTKAYLGVNEEGRV